MCLMKNHEIKISLTESYRTKLPMLLKSLTLIACVSALSNRLREAIFEFLKVLLKTQKTQIK